MRLPGRASLIDFMITHFQMAPRLCPLGLTASGLPAMGGNGAVGGFDIYVS